MIMMYATKKHLVLSRRSKATGNMRSIRIPKITGRVLGDAAVSVAGFALGWGGCAWAFNAYVGSLS